LWRPLWAWQVAVAERSGKKTGRKKRANILNRREETGATTMCVGERKKMTFKNLIASFDSSKNWA